MNKIIYNWHQKLDMAKYDIKWHQRDIEDELKELREAKGIIHRWSELSDIAYTYTRAQWTGHTTIKLPINKFQYYVGMLYMIPKIQLRWNFFYKLGKKFNKDLEIHEIRNPKKIHKLENIAKRYGIDKDEFTREAKKMMKRRIFLK